MPSNSRTELDRRLSDVEELVAAHGALTGGGRGRPAKKQGAAVCRAGVVLLSSATEAFLEDIFEEAATELFKNHNQDRLKRLIKNTSKSFSNPNADKIDLLFFNIGIPWIIADISWRKFSNASLRDSINKLNNARNKIAHGDKISVRLAELSRWKNMIEMLAPRLEEKLSVHITKVTNTPPNWN